MSFQVQSTDYTNKNDIIQRTTIFQENVWINNEQILPWLYNAQNLRFDRGLCFVRAIYALNLKSR